MLGREVALHCDHAAEYGVQVADGPRAIDWSDLAALAGSVANRKIKYRAVDDDEYRRHLARRELPDQVIDSLLALYGEFRSGWSATPTPDLSRLIGREPVDPLDAVAQRLTP